MKSLFRHGIGLVLGLAFGVAALFAAIVQMREPGLPAGGGLIAFSEVDRKTPILPSRDARGGGKAGLPTVPPGGFHFGRLSGSDLGAGCAATAAPACLAGGPLVAPNLAPDLSIATDLATPIGSTPTGASRVDDPIARLFGEDYFPLGLASGASDSARPPTITAFARDGSLPGITASTGAGFGLPGPASEAATAPGALLVPAGSEPAGADIDSAGSLARGDAAIDPVSPVPLPAGAPLLLAGLAALGIARRRRRS